jgi:thiol-disulfide isomerase/thioredoxin
MLRCIATLLVAMATSSNIAETRRAPEFSPDGYWIDGSHKSGHWLADYRGRVLLIDFWEYTCINCIRELPVLKNWYGKYKPFGLEIVGIHDGEFTIGNKLENIKQAVKRLQLPWPVVADLNGSMWRAYGAQGWPTRYLIDQQGQIVMEALGEGNYRSMEEKIRALLATNNSALDRVAIGGDNPGTDCGSATPETYLGYSSGRGAVENPEGYKSGHILNYRGAREPEDGRAWLQGKWKTEEDAVVSADHGDSLALKYHARSIYAVLSGNKRDHPLRVDVRLDGRALTPNDALQDVRFDAGGSYVDVTAPRLYYLARHSQIQSHVLTLEPQTSDLAVHSFTYGNDCEPKFDPL